MPNNSNNNSQPRQTLIRSGLKPMPRLNANLKQRVVLLRDASGSMASPGKADVASAQSTRMMGILGVAANNGAFEVCVIDFSSSSRTILATCQATPEIRVPAINAGGGTELAPALVMATQAIAAPAFGMHSYARPVVVIFSDGQTGDQSQVRENARKLRLAADIVTVAVGGDADCAFLSELATSPAHFVQCVDGFALGTFLGQVANTLTQTLSRGQVSATQQLAGLSMRRQ